MAGTEPRRCKLPSKGLTLNYCDWGNADAPPLLLLHGGRDHARSWDNVARALSTDWHVMALDWRGHGDSDWAREGAYLPIMMLVDLANFIDHVSGGQPVAIVAHSMGASLALRYTGLFPDQVHHLAAIEGIGLSGPPDFPKFVDRSRNFIDALQNRERAQPRTMPSVEIAVQRMQAAHPHLSDALSRHLTTHAVRENLDGSYSWKHDPAFRPTQIPDDLTDDYRRHLWGRIACPVWLVHGADSWAKHPDEDGRAAAFARATVTSFADAGHWVHHDRFDDFLRGLRDFLAS